MGSVNPPFTIRDTPIENLRPLKVRVIGAGYSGIYLGIRIPQRLRNIDFQIYEKNEGLGGTWWENRYPGCACDIPCEFYVCIMKKPKYEQGISVTERTGSAFIPVLLQPQSFLVSLLCSRKRD